MEQTKAARSLLKRLGVGNNEVAALVDERKSPPTIRVYVFSSELFRSLEKLTEWKGYPVSIQQSPIPNPQHRISGDNPNHRKDFDRLLKRAVIGG